MAIINPGEGMRGSIGPVVMYTLRGKTVYRSKPGPRKNGPTPGQIAQQAKFRLMMNFLKPACTLLRETFAHSAGNMSGFNKALSYNINNAIIGDYPDILINYPMVFMGQGDLPNAQGVTVSREENGLRIHWATNKDAGRARLSDRAYLALFSEPDKEWIIKLDGPGRNEGVFNMDLKKSVGQPIHGWLGFRSAKNKKSSNGIYIGSF